MRILLVQQDCGFCPLAMEALLETRLRYRIKPERDVKIISSSNRGEYQRIVQILLMKGIHPDIVRSVPLLIYDGIAKKGGSQETWERIFYRLMVA